jgi:wobble nucleotide-excising tRNase
MTTKSYLVNADFKINVEVRVEAEDEEHARREAIGEILSKNCDFLDPQEEPKINWVEAEGNEFEDDEESCPSCGRNCDC